MHRSLGFCLCKAHLHNQVDNRSEKVVNAISVKILCNVTLNANGGNKTDVQMSVRTCADVHMCMCLCPYVLVHMLHVFASVYV